MDNTDQRWIGDVNTKGLKLCMAMATVVDEGQREAFDTTFKAIDDPDRLPCPKSFSPQSCFAVLVQCRTDKEHGGSIARKKGLAKTMMGTWERESMPLVRHLRSLEEERRRVGKGQVFELLKDWEMRIEAGGGDVGTLLGHTMSVYFVVDVEPGRVPAACSDANGHSALSRLLYAHYQYGFCFQSQRAEKKKKEKKAEDQNK
ncbi:hypothetical protein Micbo1qcDRAFT_177404 [Microdochium bolleyi]|uniref:Uncharacterized protein n=1 Tax=Microdochium bolleyi TaxID=196109 RepID=A0A136IXQ8_9PEZI|nr:hypothetical protein Micbo1qcDRAFT_177404 [Microdochium bolleyi]